MLRILKAWLAIGARVHELEDVKAILDIFQKHGHYEVRAPPVAQLIAPGVMYL